MGLIKELAYHDTYPTAGEIALDIFTQTGSITLTTKIVHATVWGKVVSELAEANKIVAQEAQFRNAAKTSIDHLKELHSGTGRRLRDHYTRQIDPHIHDTEDTLDSLGLHPYVLVIHPLSARDHRYHLAARRGYSVQSDTFFTDQLRPVGVHQRIIVIRNSDEAERIRRISGSVYHPIA